MLETCESRGGSFPGSFGLAVLLEWGIGEYPVDDNFFAMHLVGGFGFGLDLIFDLHGDKIVRGEVEFLDFVEEVMLTLLFVFVFDGDLHVYLNI